MRRIKKLKRAMAGVVAGVMLLAEVCSSNVYAREYLNGETSEHIATEMDATMEEVNDEELVAQSAVSSNFANVVLYAYFDGAKATVAKQYFIDNTSRYLKYYNGSYGRSMVNYLKTVSFDKLLVENIMPQYDGTSINAYKITSVTEDDAKTRNVDASIIGELIENVPGVAEKVIDYDNDGYIDNLTVIIYGSEYANNSNTGMVSHHQVMADSSYIWSGKKVGHYNIVNSYSVYSGNAVIDGESGVIIHEFLHSLGYPDLYSLTSSRYVGEWDIMSSANMYVQYPLAYLRMHCTNWVSLDTVTTSTTLTFDLPSVKNGKQAYIIKSPLSDTEIFVVEFRKWPGQEYGENSLDRGIGSVSRGGSGLIVYRINTSVEELSNHRGQIGVYVFRPQAGQNGYVTDADTSVVNANLSQESGRTTMGSSDMNKTLSDGAIAFSDGSNSGIVISNVSSASGSTMTCKVTIPASSSYDLWKNTNLPDTTDSYSAYRTSGVCVNGINVYATVSEGKKLSLYKYSNSTWSKVGTDVTTSSALYGSPQYGILNGTAYIKTSENGNVIRKISSTGIVDSSKWTTTGINNNCNFVNANSKLYFASDSEFSGSQNKIKLYSFDGSKITNVANSNGGFYSEPYTCNIGNDIYVICSNSSSLQIYKYNNGSLTLVNNALTAGYYSATTYGSNIYIANCKSDDNLKLYKFDGTNLSQVVNATTIKNCEPSLEVLNDNLNLMTTSTLSNETEKIRVYCYDGNSSFVKEGEDVHSNTMNATLAGGDGKLYVSLVMTNGGIFVKTKTAKKTTTTQTPSGGDNNTPQTPQTPSGGDNNTPQTPQIPQTPSGGDNNTPQTPQTPQTPVEEPTPDVSVYYKTHIQNVGWEDAYKSNGQMSGTSGRSLRLEAIQMYVSGNPNLGIQYVTHCQDYGWLSWSANNEVNGTSGESKRLEAIEINLTGKDKDKYDVYYRVHAQNYGWLGWAKNGEAAGSEGYAKRLEGIQILVVKKDEKIDNNCGGITSKYQQAYIYKNAQSPVIAGTDTPHTAYQTHVQNVGWQSWKYDGEMSGTSGRSLRLEGINLKLTNKDYDGGICYTTHIQNIGWQGNENDSSTWKRDGEMSGTSGRALRLEAIRIKLTGEMANHYDIYYRVHAQNVGWMGWAKNGDPAGTAGYAYRLEGIQIVLVPKGGSAPGFTAGAFVQK